MQSYNCNRCGKQFGSPSAVRMHLRNHHFNKVVCRHCGNEVNRKEIKDHIGSKHDHQKHLPILYKPPPSNKRVKVRKNDDENVTFWEKPGVRLDQFIAPGTILQCRNCGKKLGGVHGREQHERDVHRFTEDLKFSMSLRLQPWTMLDFLDPSDVSSYLKMDLKPLYCDTTACNSEVNKLVDFLLKELPYEISHVIRGGSYGKQTCLKGHSDLDMVMFVEGFPLFGGSYSSRKHLNTCLSEIKTRLQHSLLATRVLINELTPHSIRFQYQCFKNAHVHHVDLMPCNDLLGSTPSPDDKKVLYELLANSKSQHEIQLLNASIIQLQIEFVRNQPGIVHDLIRLVKHWRLTSFAESTSLNRYRRLPNSYSLELITIHVWQSQGKPVKFELRQGLAAVLCQLVHYENLQAFWLENYSVNNKHLQKTLSGTRPIVVDPGNPLNNVCDSTNCWDELAYVARESLKRPLFRNLKMVRANRKMRKRP